MIRAARAEFLLMHRPRLWGILLAFTVVFSVAVTWAFIAGAEDSVAGSASHVTVTMNDLRAAGGATTGVIAAMSFSSLLVFAAFVASMANEYTRGTLRSAFTRQPDRLGLVGGKVAARFGVTLGLMVIALAIGTVTAFIAAPNAVDTGAWTGGDALTQTLEDTVRVVGYLAFFAVIGTAFAVVFRSTPLALGVGLVWFGPIENAIGEGRDWADRWFPGLIARAEVRPDPSGVISTATAAWTMVLYAAVAIVVTAWLVHRRDVTA